MLTPSQRSLALMKQRGYTCQNVEYYNPYSKRRKDLLGFIDILCVGKGEIIGIQATTTSHLPNREQKARGTEALYQWLRAGNKFYLHGWAKRGAKGKRKLWKLTEKKVG